MKNEDHSFKFLAAVIIAGVILAFVPSSHALDKSATPATSTALSASSSH